VLSDEAGESSIWVTPTATGQSTITIALAPDWYSPPPPQPSTVVGTPSALDLVAVAQGENTLFTQSAENVPLHDDGPQSPFPAGRVFGNGTKHPQVHCQGFDQPRKPRIANIHSLFANRECRMAA
jgi:hypothetical protein